MTDNFILFFQIFPFSVFSSIFKLRKGFLIRNLITKFCALYEEEKPVCG